MDAWCRRTHGQSGLLDRVQDEGVSLAEAERLTLNFVKRYCYVRTAPLCGNSIGQDKRFLARYMPKLDDFLHYRIVDVSSIKTLISQWYEGRYEAPKKKDAHRALPDIEESIAELDYYRKTVFIR
jgi:oligoribonuclease